MEFETIDSTSLKQLFIEQMEDAILSGELSIGERLPTERELELQMKVSRNVITSGFNELERIGFIEIRPRKGVFVADYRETGSVETLTAIMRHGGGTLRLEEVRSLLELRQAAEENMVRLVIQRASDEELNSLVVHLEAILNTSDNRKAAEASWDFYHRLSIISQNMVYPLLYQSFRESSVSLWTRQCERYGILTLYQNRVILFQALSDRDPKAAIELVRTFMYDSIYGDKPIYTDS